MVAASALWGCADIDPAAPDERAPSDVVVGQVPTSTSAIVEPPATLRYDLAVTVAGPLRPGAAVEVRAELAGILPTADVQLSVISPELAAAEHLRWPRRFRVPPRVRLEPHGTARVSTTPGSRRIESFRLVFPRSGTYSVVVTARQLSDEPPVSPSFGIIQGTVHRTVWLRIDEAGGMQFERDDPPSSIGYLPHTAVPSGAAPSAGVLSSQAGDPLQSISCDEPQLICAWAGWWDNDSSFYRPLAGIDMELTAYDIWTDQPLYGDYAVSDSDGYAYFYCLGMNEYGEIESTFSDSDVGIIGYMTNFEPLSAGACETLERVGPLSSVTGELYRVLKQIVIPSSRALLQQSRGGIAAGVTFEPQDWAGVYYRSADEMWVTDDFVYGANGRKVIAHEYGHAVHEKALSGMVDSDCREVNGVTQPYDEEHNLGCALVEGFAEFHAAMTVEASNTWRAYFESNSGLESGEDGSIVPEAVGATLFDFVDSASDPNDATTYPGSYVGNLIESCLVVNPGNWYWTRADGIDHIMYCAELTIDRSLPSQGMFDLRSQPDHIAAPSTPTGWSASAVRDGWTWNLYLR